MANDSLGLQGAGEERSVFAKKLASDPELAARCEAVATELRDAAKEELKAVERSEQLTSEDFAVYINARADSALGEKD
jgi:hypothetical protein